MMSENKPLVSIIIPTWNRKDELTRCLESIREQDYPAIETIVADDASDDDTVEMLGRNFPEVRVLTDTVRCGHYHRRNQAICASRGEWVLTLDSDIILQDPGLVSRQVACLQRDASIGQLGGEIPIHLGETKNAYGWGLSPGWYPKHITAEGADEDLTECAYLGAGCFIARKEILQEAGGFDPYYEFGQADTDLGLKIKAMGYRNYVGRNYAMHHNASKGGRRFDVTERYCNGRVRLLLKRRGLFLTLLQYGWDLFLILRFFLIRPFLKFRGKEPDPLQEAGARQIPRSYWKGFSQYVRIHRMRKVNFLDPEEMKRFHAIKTATGK